MEGVDVSAVQSHILYEIDSNDQPSMQQVADLLGIDIATFSRQIQTLVKMDLVEKIPSKEDKRASNLILTEKGEKVAREIDTQVNAFLQDIFSSMTDFERQTVQGAVKLLADVMTKSPLCCGNKKESGSC